MMAHIAPSEYAIHGHEAPSYNAPMEYYAGDYLPPQQADPAGFHRPQHHLSEEASALADALAGIDIAQSGRGKPTPPPNKELVVHAIEAAASVLRDQASALRDQISENERLRSALRVREWELQNYQRIDQGLSSRHMENLSQDDFQTLASYQQLGPPTLERSALLQGPNQPPLNRELWAGNGFIGDPQSSLIVHPNAQSLSENHYRYPSNGVQGAYGPNFGTNGTIRQRNLPDSGFSRNSSPTARSMSPIRLAREGESAARLQPGGVHGNAQPRQDLVTSTPGPQDEIKQLKKLLADCALKEMQLVHENHMLEKRISELRLTIEKYQQELVDATSRESSIRRDVMEENARLASEIRTALQDINLYASSLMPLLAEFNLQPATRDPHSIVSGIKALVQHLREEGRKDSILPKQPWQSPQTYQPSPHGVSSSPAHPMAWAPKSPEPHGLEIVPQQPYLQPERSLSPTSPLSHNQTDWDVPGASNAHLPFSTDNYSSENARRSPYSRQTGEPQHIRLPVDYNTGAQQRNDPYNNTDEDLNPQGHSYGPEYAERPEHPSPQLPPVMEEDPTSSLSDDEDPLPDIEGLVINGEAVLGNKITACGISINGTTLCHFQWVRHHRDGSYFHIPGAAQPDYTITADDVDTLLSLECTPMDDRNRKGQMVQVFVNNHNRIALESDMKDQIIDYLENGQANFEVKHVIETQQDVSVEPALLMLKRSIYELKRLNGKRITGNERYASESVVEIKVGKDTQCAIINSIGMHVLDCSDNRMRDLLVLTMREFIKAAIERKRGKKSFWSK